LNPKQRQKIGERIEGELNDIDWQRVGDLAHSPRAVPVPVTGGHEGIDAVIARSARVQDILPAGSNWDGRTGLLVDEKTFNELINGRTAAPPAAESPAALGAPDAPAAPVAPGAQSAPPSQAAAQPHAGAP
jgi:hypothetical protein